MQVSFNGLQAETLCHLMRDYIDGEDVVITAGHNGSVVVAFSMATITIDVNGVPEEN